MNSSRNGETLTQGLIGLIRNKPVTPDDLGKAALFTLDAVANAFAGRSTDAGRKLLAWGRGFEADSGRHAFVMGGLTHILEVDDLHRAAVVHTGCVTVPAAFALSRGCPISGEAFLTAVIHGFEAMCRIGMAVGPEHYKVWHNTGTCGPYGSAMTAATVLGLDDEAAMHALGNAGTQSAGLWQFLATGAMSKHLHAGRAAEAGVVAGELAALGFTGPPAILEGAAGFFAGACPDADPDAVLRDPLAPWQLHNTSIKPWPSCRHTHPVIGAALELAPGLDVGAVERIEVTTYGAALDVCDRPVASSAYEAKFSLQHCVAAALQRGRVDFEAFDEAARQTAAPLAQSIRVNAGEPYDSAYPAAWGGEVALRLDDGQTLTARREHCKGDPEVALDGDEMSAKAHDLLEYGGINDPGPVIEQILAMADGAAVPEISVFDGIFEGAAESPR
jgi:2-methylcitrate dehydratase PrpD